MSEYKDHVWANLALTIELHAASATEDELVAVTDAWDDHRPTWAPFGAWLSTYEPPKLEMVIPMAVVTEAGHSPDEVRKAACDSLLAAGIAASVRIGTEWMVWVD